MDKFIEENYNKLLELAKSVCHRNDYEDILNECLLYLLERKDKYVDKIERGEMSKYINTMLRFSSFSKRSFYQNKYKFIKNEKYYFCFLDEIYDDIDEINEEMKIETILDIIENDLDVLEKIVIKEKIRIGIPTLSKNTKVSAPFLYKIYKKGKEKIKNKLYD